jgi:SH3 domain-containing YSC84-like protein 1
VRGELSVIALGGGSVGFQGGGEATDFVLPPTNDRPASRVLRSKVKLDANASAAAGRSFAAIICVRTTFDTE